MTEHTELSHFVEDAALHWEHHGLPRIAGRILGLLMVCEPPYRSASQLEHELGASRGSVHAMTRLLLTGGTIETTAVPGDRATYYRLAPNSFEEKFEKRLGALMSFQELANRGLELLRDAPPERSAHLRELLSMYSFMERELPLLFERWRQERDG